MTTVFHSHWHNVPEGAWRWPNFSPASIACRGTCKLLINEPALDKLQALRDRLGKPLIVRSAYRSPEHNRAVRGATRSKHLDGAAFDIAMANHDPAAFEGEVEWTTVRWTVVPPNAREVGFLGFGFYPRRYCTLRSGNLVLTGRAEPLPDADGHAAASFTMDNALLDRPSRTPKRATLKRSAAR